MITWTMVIYIYAGVLAKGDSVALDHISGFESQQQCEMSAKDLEKLTKNSAKVLRAICIEGGK